MMKLKILPIILLSAFIFTFSSCDEKETIRDALITVSGLNLIAEKNYSPVGLDIQINAFLIYSDGSEVQCTNDVIGTSLDNNIASISISGLATGLSIGSVSIKAEHIEHEMQNQITLLITNAEPQSLLITPGSSIISLGNEAQIKAYIVYSDGSKVSCINNVDWTSLEDNIVTIGGPAGLATSVAAGSTYIKADHNVYGYSEQIPVQVTTAIPESIYIVPSSTTTSLGIDKHFNAFLVYSDSSETQCTNDVAWSSLNEEIVTISESGVVSGISLGTAGIKAEYSSLGSQAQAQIDITASRP